MENFRSMSCRDGRVKMESFNNGGNGEEQNRAASAYPSSMQDMRSFSTSYASSSAGSGTNPSYHAQNPNNLKVERNQNESNGDHHKSSSRRSTSSSSSSRGGGWSFADPELQRKKRVASYKVYAVEGKMKGSLRKSFKWIKNTCSQVVYGWR